MNLPWLFGKRIVVTGAAGFLGSHLVDRLLAEGAFVTGIDNLITGNRNNLAHLSDNSHFKLIEADVCTDASLYLPADRPIDGILHFASPASPPRYQAKPIETYQVNSLATHNLLQFLKNTNPQARFFFASTSEVYGDPTVHPQPEDYWGYVNPNGLRSCYDEGKRLGETICGVHHRSCGMDVRIVRIFNTYGPRMDATDGRIIPNFVSQALKRMPITIHGDGTQTRSFCYVSDLVEGILRYFAADGLAGETVNIGNPGEFTALEAAKMIWQTVHGNEESPTFHFLPEQPDDPTRRRPDISKAKRLLDWEPTISFEAGLQPTVEFFKNQAIQSLHLPQ